MSGSWSRLPARLMTKPLPAASERNGSPSPCPGGPWGPRCVRERGGLPDRLMLLRKRGPKKNSKGRALARPRGRFSIVAAWIETTAGSTAWARSAKLGNEVIGALLPAIWVADSDDSASAARPGTVRLSPPASTMPNTTAPRTSRNVVSWRLWVVPGDPKSPSLLEASKHPLPGNSRGKRLARLRCARLSQPPEFSALHKL